MSGALIFQTFHFHFLKANGFSNENPLKTDLGQVILFLIIHNTFFKFFKGFSFRQFVKTGAVLKISICGIKLIKCLYKVN